MAAEERITPLRPAGGRGALAAALGRRPGRSRPPSRPAQPPYYVLEMFPYPSGRIHMGHVRNYTIGDVIARQRRMRGLQRAASDRLGRLRPAGRERRHPARRASGALDRRQHRHMRRQLQRLGLHYDWERELATCDPDYYRWEQLFFLAHARARPGVQAARRRQLVRALRDGARERAGDRRRVLALRRAGGGARARAVVLPHHRLRRRAARRSRSARRAGRSACSPCSATGSGAATAPRSASRSTGREGAIRVFTTRPDTLFGATFVSLAPEHPLVAELRRRHARGGRRRGVRRRAVRASDATERAAGKDGRRHRRAAAAIRSPASASRSRSRTSC